MIWKCIGKNPLNQSSFTRRPFSICRQREPWRSITGTISAGKQKKAACVNIVSGIDSKFLWKGKIDSSQEILLIIKTRASMLPQIIELVKTVHSYEVPEIIAIPIIGGNDDYLKWMDIEVKE